MTARTPGPWYVSKLPDYGVDVSIYAETSVHKNPRWIARVYGEGPLTKDTSERDANAAFIVKACNAHDALTAENAALREALLELLQAESEDLHEGSIATASNLAAVVNKARAALAEGEK